MNIIMEKLWGPLKLIRFEDTFLIRIGGHPGYDCKLIFKKPEWRHHYTFSIRLPQSRDLSNLHTYLHKTEETQPKQYTTLLEGRFNFEKLVGNMVPKSFPEIRRVDLSNREFVDQEIIPFTPEVLKLFFRKELLVSREMLSLFEPKPVSRFNSVPFSMGMPVGNGIDHSMIIKTNFGSFALKFPSIDSIEDKMSDVLEVDNFQEIEDFMQDA